MAESKLPIVVMTGDQLRHHYFANRLAEHFEVRGVVSETVYKPPMKGAEQEVDDLKRHFLEREQAEARFFGGDADWALPGDRVRAIPKGEANSDAIYEWIIGREAKYLLLYGSSIIKERLLRAFDGRCVNMHLGLSPYYRGSGTNFWPLVDGEPELVGATIHLATLDVDAGAILKQARPGIEAGDRNHDIGCRAIIAGTRAMIEALSAYDRGEIEPQRQAEGGRLFRRADFNVEAVRRMWRNLDDGMVEDYLQHPERAARYPIVE